MQLPQIPPRFLLRFPRENELKSSECFGFWAEPTRASAGVCTSAVGAVSFLVCAQRCTVGKECGSCSQPSSLGWNSTAQALHELAQLHGPNLCSVWDGKFRNNLRLLCQNSEEKQEESSRAPPCSSRAAAAAAAHGQGEDFLVEVGLCVHQVEEVQEAAVLLIPVPWQGTEKER